MALDPSVSIHEKALCESAEVGPRTRVWAFAHIMKGAKVGADCNVGDHAFIESGARIGDRVIVKNGSLIWDKVTIEDDVFVGPNVLFTNDMHPRVAFKNPPERFLPTRIGRGASIGAGVVIVCGVTIGEQAFIGAGAVILRDVPAHALMAGNPARRIGWVCVCAQRLSRSLTCQCGRAYARMSAQAGLIAKQSGIARRARG